MNAATLASQFSIAGALDFVDTENGLAKAVVSCGGMTGELLDRKSVV